MIRHWTFKGWDYYAEQRAKRLEVATQAGHPEWAQLPSSEKKAGGQSPFFTGRPCIRGHISRDMRRVIARRVR